MPLHSRVVLHLHFAAIDFVLVLFIFSKHRRLGYANDVILLDGGIQFFIFILSFGTIEFLLDELINLLHLVLDFFEVFLFIFSFVIFNVSNIFVLEPISIL